MIARILDLDQLHLDKGAHRDPADGLCLLEAVAYVAGEVHTDAPRCVSPVLAEFGRTLNDWLDDVRRQELKLLIARLPGTAGDGLDEARGYMALDWLIRTYTPTWLELAGLSAEAAQLRALRRIVDQASAQAAGPIVRAVTRSAAGAVGDAARDAVCQAARDAAWQAAGDAAWHAARDAAWTAARTTALAAAGDAAWHAARAASRVVARDAAGAAARGAAMDALQSTVDQLQASTIDLFTRMIRPDSA